MNEAEKKILGEIVGGIERMEITGVSIDSRTIKAGELFVAIRGDRFDGHDFVPDALKKGAWGAVVERAVLETRYASIGGLKNIIAVEDTLLSLQEMSLIHRKKFSLPVVGITGSNGKTTTKEMLACILRQKGPVLRNEGNLNNHIGVPLTLLKLDASHRSAVIEMGMSAAGEIETLTRLVSPDVGVITNIGPAHLEFLGSTDMVAQAKAELIENMRLDGTAVLNADDPYFDMLKGKFYGSILSFGIKNKADVKADGVRPAKDAMDFTLRTDGSSVPVRLRAVGTHNVSNALAAAAAALAVGMPMESVKFGLEDFSPVAMRSELRPVEGRLVLADYYNANPGSVTAALETLVSLRSGKAAVAVLGDMLELGEAAPEAHRDVGRTAARLGVDLLITVGTLAAYIAEGAIDGGMPRERVVEAKSHAAAAALLKERTRRGDTVLIKGSRGMKMEKILEEF
jgi:UDP-N-acetylmuramoyl-tripeptide--D-alanyl-D-alanine ligase